MAAFDCDDDHRPELYLAGGAAPAALYHNDSAPGVPPTFAPLDRPELALTAVTGAYPLDIDGDGFTDLAVLRAGEDVLLRGLGGCRFERANEAWGFDGGDAWTTAFSATWESEGAWPTLAFGSYLRLTDGQPDRSGCADGVYLRPAHPSARTPRPSRSRRPGAACRCCSATGTAPGSATCVSPTTATTTPTTAMGRSSCGASSRVRRPPSTRRRTAGSGCGSRAWASPARTSRVTVSRTCTSRARRPAGSRRSPRDRTVRSTATWPTRPGSRAHSHPWGTSICRPRRGIRSSRTSTTTA